MSLPADPTIDGNGSVDTSQIAKVPPRFLEDLGELNFTHLLYFWTVARDGSIARACDRLQLSQPTISMQIRKLEKSLGQRLFDRSGRSLTLTEVGRTVYDYADEIFSLGREMLGTMRGLPGNRSGRLHVGMPAFLPKLVAYRLLDPVLHSPAKVQLFCHEAEMSELVSGLMRHKYDVILTDTQIHATMGVRTFSHPLGECEIAICGVPMVAKKYSDRFPESLDGAPFVLPTVASDMRRTLDRWFDHRSYRPSVIGEFDDSALLKEFGGGGEGLFPIPSAVLADVQRQYGVELVGRLPGVRVRYFAVTTERKLVHPATVIIAQTAKSGLLSEPTD